MIKKVIFLLISFIFVTYSISFSQEEDKGGAIPMKNILLNVGGGRYGFDAGMSFRYWHLGINAAFSGFSEKMPGYLIDSRYKPMEGHFRQDSYTRLVFNGGLDAYYDISDYFTVFAGAGFYAKADSVLAYDFDSGDRYAYKNKTETGISFELGLQYVLSENLDCGAAYNTTLGFYLQLGYYWF